MKLWRNQSEKIPWNYQSEKTVASSTRKKMALLFRLSKKQNYGVINHKQWGLECNRGTQTRHYRYLDGYEITV